MECALAGVRPSRLGGGAVPPLVRSAGSAEIVDLAGGDRRSRGRRSSISRAEIVALPCMLSSASRRPGRRRAQRALLPVGRRGARSVARAAARRLRGGWGWGEGGVARWRGRAGSAAWHRLVGVAWRALRCRSVSQSSQCDSRPGTDDRAHALAEHTHTGHCTRGGAVQSRERVGTCAPTAAYRQPAATG